MNNLNINASVTALVVIDLQKGIVGFNAAPHAADLVVKRAALLAESFRKRGSPVFLVRVTPSSDGKDALDPLADAGFPGGVPPSDWADVVPEMGSAPSDFVITKRQWGAFYGTELDLQVRRRGIKTIVLCGLLTNFGVESTARVAFEHGYHQIFAEDAMSAFTVEEHTSTIKNIFPRIGLVRATEEILASIN